MDNFINFLFNHGFKEDTIIVFGERKCTYAKDKMKVEIDFVYNHIRLLYNRYTVAEGGLNMIDRIRDIVILRENNYVYHVSKVKFSDRITIINHEMSKGINIRYINSIYKDESGNIYIIDENPNKVSQIVYFIRKEEIEPSFKQIANRIEEKIKLYKEIHKFFIDNGFEYKKINDVIYYDFGKHITIRVDNNILELSVLYLDKQKSFHINKNIINDINNYLKDI